MSCITSGVATVVPLLGPEIARYNAIHHELQVDVDELCEAIRALLQSVGDNLWKPWDADKPLAKLLEFAYPWGRLDWARSTVSVRRSAQLLLKHICDGSHMLALLNEHFLMIL